MIYLANRSDIVPAAIVKSNADHIKIKCDTTHNNSLSCLIVRTLSAPIYLSNSPGVFCHRAILTMGGSDRGWGFPHRTNRFALYPFRLSMLSIVNLTAEPSLF